ncbi:MAG: hypothetical protein ABJA50_00430 [Chloroflexota bacterium]
MSDPTEPISIVEDLDPEPPSQPGFSQRLELILGVALLACVLGFVAYQWWHQQAQISDYSSGQSAINSSDWDAALTYFTRVGDYRDAGQQATHAREQVTERNRLYASAQQDVAKNEWLAALTDVRAAALIQPTYRDLPALEETARQNVYSEALSGTVALRPTASPPGLYLRNADTWVYLQDSDRQSRVEEPNHNGHLVYDARDGSGSRHLVSAQLVGDEFKYTPLSFDPAGVVQCLSTIDGVWVTTPGSGLSGVAATVQTAPVVRTSYSGFTVAYQPYTSTLTYTISPPTSFSDSTGSDIVVAFGPRDQYLITYYTGGSATGVTNSTIVNLYLGTAGSATRQLIYVHSGGGLQSAQLSPDGRFALVTTFTLLSRTYEQQSVVLIDLQNTTSPYVLRDVMLPNGPAGQPRDALNSIFVQYGAFAGDLLLAQYRTDHTDVLLIDPAKVSRSQDNQALVSSVPVPGTASKSWIVVKQDSQGVVLAGQDNDFESPITPTLVPVIMPVSGPPIVITIPTRQSDNITSFRSTDTNFVWTYGAYGPYSASNDLAALSISNTATITDTGEITPNLIFSQSVNPGESRRGLAPSVTLGDNLLAYTVNRELHVLSYEGTLDLRLENGVTALYDANHIAFYGGWLK